MATAKKDLEISIEAIELDKTVFKGRSKRIMDFKIIYPRLTLAQKTTSKTLTLDGGKVVKPGFVRWVDSILFKENVQGTFGLECSVSSPASGKELEGAAASAGGSLLRLFGDLIASATGLKTAGSFTELPIDALAKVVTSSAYSSKAVAQGAIDITGEDYEALKTGQATVKELPLLAVRDIVEEKHRSTKSQADKVTRKTVIKAETQIGRVKLKISAM